MRFAFALAASLLPLALPAVAAPQAGVAAVVVGDVTVSEGERPGPVAASTGMRMDLGDRVSSAEQARMQILLLDQTVFTVGPNSDLVIDRFVYNPQAGTGEVAASYSRGLLRYVSGQVAKLQPDNVSIRTPMGTIGVRGTAMFLADDPESGGIFAGLIGPGSGNNANARPGALAVSNPLGQSEVTRPDYGVLLKPGEPPSPPMPTPPRLQQLLVQQLTAAALPAGAAARSQAAAPAGGGTAASGQGVAQTRAAAADTASTLTATAGLATLATQAAEEGAALNASDSSRLARMEPLIEGFGELPFGVAIPFGVQMSWANISDLDLHLTGPNAGTSGRFHIYFANRGDYSAAPFFAVLDNDRVGVGGSEVIGISQFNPGGPYRASVFNFGDQSSGSTSLADQSDLVVSFIRNGFISRGPGGSALVNGETVLSISPTAGQPGNTFVAFEIDPVTKAVTPVGTIVNSAGSGSVQ